MIYAHSFYIFFLLLYSFLWRWVHESLFRYCLQHCFSCHVQHARDGSSATFLLFPHQWSTCWSKWGTLQASNHLLSADVPSFVMYVPAPGVHHNKQTFGLQWNISHAGTCTCVAILYHMHLHAFFVSLNHNGSTSEWWCFCQKSFLLSGD